MYMQFTNKNICYAVSGQNILLKREGKKLKSMGYGSEITVQYKFYHATSYDNYM